MIFKQLSQLPGIYIFSHLLTTLNYPPDSLIYSCVLIPRVGVLTVLFLVLLNFVIHETVA